MFVLLGSSTNLASTALQDDLRAVHQSKFYPFVIVIVVAAVLGWFLSGWLSGKREPAYKGRSLSQWIGRLPGIPTQDSATEADRAVREIGTNAVPFLLEWIAYEPEPWRDN